MNRMGRIGWVVLFTVFCLGSAALGAEETKEGRAPYRIGIEDVLDINVWKNPDVSRKVWVRPDGRITVPLVGEVYAEGLSVEELTGILTEKLKEYFTDPLVTVTLDETNSYNVYLLGRVKTPGVMRLRSPRTFLQVLAMAGGFQEFADSDSVVVMRWNGGRAERIHVDVEKMLKKGSVSDFELRPGDVIIVP
ncbi:MAG: polysaccharide export protein [Deferrisomatales bacterium]